MEQWTMIAVIYEILTRFRKLYFECHYIVLPKKSSHINCLKRFFIKGKQSEI